MEYGYRSTAVMIHNFLEPPKPQKSEKNCDFLDSTTPCLVKKCNICSFMELKQTSYLFGTYKDVVN